MKKTISVLTTILAMTAGAAWAGDDEHEKKKCAAEATVCVRETVATLRQRGWIGIEWERQDGRPRISHVVEGSPAEAADVRVNDVVMAFNGISTSEAEEVMWAEMKRVLVPGKVITLSVVRDGSPRDLDVELIAVPEQIIAQWVGKHVMEHHAAPPDGNSPESP